MSACHPSPAQNRTSSDFAFGPLPDSCSAAVRGWLILEPLEWLEHTEAGGPSSAQLCFRLSLIISR